MNEEPISEALKKIIESLLREVHYDPIKGKQPVDPILKEYGVQLLACVYITVIIGIIIFLLKASQ